MNAMRERGGAGEGRAAPRKWVVLLVHGVGDTKPHVMIDSVGAAVGAAVPGLTPDGWYEVVAPAAGSAPAEREPMIWRRRGRTATGEPVAFAQVFWADLSRIQEDWFTRLVGLFSLIFGFRHVAHAAADQPSLFAKVLRRLLWFASFVLRGPVLALYVFALVFALLSGVLFAAGLAPASPAAPWLLLASGVAAAGVGLYLWVRNVRWVAAPWASLVLVGLTAVVVAAGTLSDKTGGAVRVAARAARLLV